MVNIYFIYPENVDSVPRFTPSLSHSSYAKTLPVYPLSFNIYPFVSSVLSLGKCQGIVQAKTTGMAN
ncbi:MAG: hypothetical protein QNJ36_07635 [Calothrix sp. MO_167.B42]|nr:hypothetical protein [Calothrix sp. MO_167.B42]